MVSGLIRKETAVSESTTAMTGVMIDPVTGEIIDQKELAERLLAQAKEQGVSLASRRSQPTCATAPGQRPC